MHFSTLTVSTLAFAARVISANHCQLLNDIGSYTYGVRAENVDDVPGVCGGLWDNLKQFAACPVGSVAECTDIGDGALTWTFLVGHGCNSG